MALLVPGTISPTRPVPQHIARPPYVGHPAPEPFEEDEEAPQLGPI